MVNIVCHTSRVSTAVIWCRFAEISNLCFLTKKIHSTRRQKQENCSIKKVVSDLHYVELM